MQPLLHPLSYPAEQACMCAVQWKELRNGRLALIALVGFAFQYGATGKGPLDNLLDHINDPTHVNVATNGVSLPYVNPISVPIF